MPRDLFSEIRDDQVGTGGVREQLSSLGPGASSCHSRLRRGTYSLDLRVPVNVGHGAADRGLQAVVVTNACPRYQALGYEHGVPLLVFWNG